MAGKWPAWGCNAENVVHPPKNYKGRGVLTDGLRLRKTEAVFFLNSALKLMYVFYLMLMI